MRLFCFSDCHGFATELIDALKNAGFESGNPNMLLVGLGDYTDRGTENAKVIEYLQSIPNKVLVKGNHESLVEHCIERGFPYSNDYLNGTYDTICELGGLSTTRNFKGCCIVAEQKLKPFWNEMIDYYETENYIFVHSFVPINCGDGIPVYYKHPKNRKFSKIENWREAHHSEWEDARWGNPFELAEKGLLPEKTLVFGHWHCSTGWAKKEGCSEFDDDAKFEPFHGDGYIAIDACVAHSGKVNVLMLEDNLLEE